VSSGASNQSLILGLDPGSRCTGYGLIREVSGTLELISTGTVRPDLEDRLSDRLGSIFEKLSTVIDMYLPDEAAAEDVFVSRNTSSALKLGQARGAALTACASRRVPVYTYEPALVKKTLVGNGRADKDQVGFMVGRLLGVKPNWSRDCGDALAVAICHLNMRRIRFLETCSGTGA
jgi:crossover junction endodeoxyribonuclease RuvC